MSLTKNSLISILAASVMLISMTACSNTENTESNDTTTTAESTTTTTTTTEETQANYELDEADLYALELLNCYADEEGRYRVDESTLELTDDYDLFREYFFGTWEGTFCYPSGEKKELMTIDDTEEAYFMTNYDLWLNGFYKVGDDVIAFIYGSSAGASINWLDINEPDTMYIVWGGLGKNNFIYNNNDGSITIYTLTKSDAPLKEPENNFISIYKLYEISKAYGIDFDVLVNIDYENEGGTEPLHHNDKECFLPVYLVCEAEDKLVFETTVRNGYSSEQAFAYCTIEKINGEWVRTVEFGETVILE